MAELVDQPNAISGPVQDRTSRRSWVAAASPAALRTRLNVRAWSAVHQFLFVLCLLYLVKQVIFVLAFPAFTGHDEVAHYAGIQVLATEGRLPEIPELSEWREMNAAGVPTTEDRIPAELYKYCRYVTQDWFCKPEDARFRDDGPHAVTFAGEYYPSGWIYTANHPPIYYTLMVPIYWLSTSASPTTQLYIFRMAAIPFGLLTVLLAFLTVRALFQTDRFLLIVVPTFVAFQTQVSYEAAMLNNDIVSILSYSLVLYLLVLALRDRFSLRLCVLLGVALGLALLTKSTALTAVGLVGLAFFLRLGFKDLRGVVVRGAAIVLPLLALAAPWYAYLYNVYGNFSALEQIQALQWWNFNNESSPSFFDLLFNVRFAEDRFNETWGQFGWRLIPLNTTLLWVIGLPLLVCLLGLGQYAATVIRSRGAAENDPVERPENWQKLAILMMLIACVVAYLAIIQFGTEFSLTQARYYFPVINAVAILLGLGLRSLIPKRFHPYGQGGVLAAMILLNTVIFTQYVIPYWELTT